MQFFSDLKDNSLSRLLEHYGMQLIKVEKQLEIPGSHWGNTEAGLIGPELYIRSDTPIHSALHETCHYICMDDQRRNKLHTDAGGDYDEENAVCYLQILLADHITGNSQSQLMQEMDEWGYSFRLGSASQWFYHDAEDARQWLLDSDLITPDNYPTWNIKHG